ncbi:MAG: methylmalonyl-CoA epimerase [Bacteroidetes bacterium]|nr:methylmalonyl-CoA epimerase [Bacteroidota bacterium]
MITSLNHIGIAVRDLEISKALYQKIFEVKDFHTEIVEEQMVQVASFKVGNVLVELTAPTSPESAIAKFLEKRGEGIHHIAFGTNNIGNELTRLNDVGIQLINSEAREGAHEMLIAFLHPKSTGGVLMELCEPK